MLALRAARHKRRRAALCAALLVVVGVVESLLRARALNHASRALCLRLGAALALFALPLAVLALPFAILALPLAVLALALAILALATLPSLLHVDGATAVLRLIELLRLLQALLGLVSDERDTLALALVVKRHPQAFDL